jgi:hypothetical protein
VTAPTVDHKALAGELERRGDWEGARRAYEDAIRAEPGDFRLRYRLGVALSHLDMREDATGVFKWVVANGPHASEEVRLAQQWLEAAITKAVAAAPSSGSASSTATNSPVEGRGAVRGRTEWTTLDLNKVVPRIQIQLASNDPPPRQRLYSTRVLLNEPYEIKGVVAGQYRLTAQSGMTRLWEMSITVAEDSPTVVDLTQSASVAPPDTFKPAS